MMNCTAHHELGPFTDGSHITLTQTLHFQLTCTHEKKKKQQTKARKNIFSYKPVCYLKEVLLTQSCNSNKTDFSEEFFSLIY